MTLLTQTRSFLSDRFDALSSTTLLVGVSGGPDSMVLLDVLRELQTDFGYRLLPLHLNYRFHSQANEAFEVLLRYCRSHGLTPVAASLLEPERHRRASEGLEARARTLRYDFFEKHAEGFGAGGVLLAHHRDDQVETILLNLGRGCGPGALAGMSDERRRGDVRIYRPFLSAPQSVLMKYAHERDLPYLEDPMNEDEGYARNRLRHTVLPEWEQVQPAPTEAIANLAGRVKRENDFWEQYLEEVLEDWRWSGEIQVAREVFSAQHPAVQFRYLRSLVESLTGSLQGWNEDNLGDVRELFAEGRSGARLTLPGDVHALNEYDRGCLLTSSVERHAEIEAPFELPVERDWLDAGTLEIKPASGELPPSERPGGRSTLGRDQLENLLVRTWSEGDTLRGPEGTVALKDVFEDNRVPFRARRYWPVLDVNGEVVGLPGLINSPENGDAVAVDFRPDHPSFAQLGNGYTF